MEVRPKILLALTGVAALSLAYPASVQASVTYQYTGNHFTEVSGPYTTSMFVTAMVTLAAPLGANLPEFTDVTPIAFTLFDGVQTLSSSTPGIAFDTFQFGTNAAGQITSWQVSVDIGVIGAITNFILTLKLEDPQDPHIHDTGGMQEIGGQFRIAIDCLDVAAFLVKHSNRFVIFKSFKYGEILRLIDELKKEFAAMKKVNKPARFLDAAEG